MIFISTMFLESNQRKEVKPNIKYEGLRQIPTEEERNRKPLQGRIIIPWLNNKITCNHFDKEFASYGPMG